MTRLTLVTFMLILTTAMALLPATAQQDDIHIPDDNLATAIRRALGLNEETAITAAAMRELTELDAPDAGIAALTGLQHATNLTALDLRGNPIADIAVLANLTQLEWLNLWGTAVSDIAVLANLTQLEWLNLWGTAVSDIAVLANLTKLTELHLSGTAVSDIAVLANLTQLTTLGLAYTAVSDIAVLADLTKLTELHLSGTAVSDIAVLANLTQLTRLELDDTAVSDIAVLANLTQLEWLNLWETAVSDIAVLANLTQLTWLGLAFTAVSDVSALANLTQLTTLILSDTAVSDIAVLANLTQLTWLDLGYTFAVSDVSVLANLTQLTTLILNSTAVSDVSALANLTQLEWLYLVGTAVSDVSPLLGLNLTGTSWDSIGLYLNGCPLSYASLHTHIPALQAKGIEVEFDNVAHPALLKVTGDGTSNTLVVEATDENGQPIVGKTVLFENLQGGGTLSANTVETDARGRARVTLMLGETTGTNKVKASAEGIASWVLFNTGATETAPQLVADVNGDGVVNIQDLVFVSGQFGKTGKHSADVNGDGVVNIQDLVLVAAAFGEAAAAPALAPGDIETGSLQAADVRQWLRDAKAANADPIGIAVLERLLAALTRIEAPPKETALLANYPNPFNPETWIPYQLAEPAEVQVSIYAADGKLVRRLELGQLPAGTYQNRSRAAYWDGRNAQGEPVASGVYFYTLTAGEFTATRKMVIRK